LSTATLAIESLLFIWVHVQYREPPAIIMSGVLGLLMAFLAYGRSVLRPL
jgi:xanthosine utilization system XapX-like protein